MLRMRSKQNEMPIPTRTAPRPPGSAIDQRNLAWSNNDPFGPLKMPTQKKKPPPRPPPPRIRRDNFQNQQDKSKKPTRPTELLTNLFGLKSTKQQQINVAFSGHRASNTNNAQTNHLLDGTVSLIDLSPPGSPTFTTRSSSDGVSVDSFGSDGNSNPSAFTSSGNTSQTESAFEDDFDFFGNLPKKNTLQTDPWKGNIPVDPFSPMRSNNTLTNSTKYVGDAAFFAYNNGPTPSFPAPVTRNASLMPTIIRARPPKPPAPKILPTSLAPTVANFNNTINDNNGGYNSTNFNTNTTWPTSFDDDTYQRGDDSPPMPSIPPPAPPQEYLIEAGTSQGQKQPQGVALYDFQSTQAGDLTLKQGDVVFLITKVSDDWLEGQIANRTGIFPANFIDIIVPLSDTERNIVNALYTFNGETWDDLPFEEGAKITVLSKISDDWLYGEYKGKKGQFPANFIDRVPDNLPQHS